MRILLAAVVLAALAAGCAPTGPAPAVDADLAIVGATVIHPERDGAAAVEREVTILVRGNRIVAVGSAIAVPAAASVIEARGKWVIPGLVDAHVHFFQSGNLYTRPDAADFSAVVRYADEVARNKARLPVTFRTWLASGVTSVADVGGPFWNFTVREAAAMSAAAPMLAPTPKICLACPGRFFRSHATAASTSSRSPSPKLVTCPPLPPWARKSNASTL